MNWSRVTSYAEISDCNRYSIAAAKTQDGIWQFQAWRIADKTVLHTGTAQDCKAACERDAAGRVAA